MKHALTRESNVTVHSVGEGKKSSIAQYHNIFYGNIVLIYA